MKIYQVHTVYGTCFIVAENITKCEETFYNKYEWTTQIKRIDVISDTLILQNGNWQGIENKKK